MRNYAQIFYPQTCCSILTELIIILLFKMKGFEILRLHLIPEVVGFSVRASSSSAGRGSSRPFYGKCNKPDHDFALCWAYLTCIHCKKKGHGVANYYEVHGYPNKARGWQSCSNPRQRCY